MPGDATAVHPSGLQIKFTEDDHRYVDSEGREYTSVTTLIHDAFPKFDADKIAPQCAAKRGISIDAIKAEWEANRDEAARQGTRMHENAEYQFLDQYQRMHQPENEDERARFATIWDQVSDIKSTCDYIEPEKIVFSPRFRIAGSIDLWAHHPERWIIGDWKLIKELSQKAYNNETGTIYPTATLPHSNYYHYVLQLSIYELLLKAEGYVNAYETIERWLLVYSKNTKSFKQEPLPSLQKEAAMLILWHMTGGLEEVPF